MGQVKAQMPMAIFPFISVDLFDPCLLMLSAKTKAFNKSDRLKVTHQVTEVHTPCSQSMAESLSLLGHSC